MNRIREKWVISPNWRFSQYTISRQNMSTGHIGDLNNTTNPLDLSDVNKILYLATTECPFISRTHGTCTKTNHMLNHKTH